ncbi:aspartate/glutamate racemase family protein [Salinarchaeum sp. IM2453]|uniref:maleate cis-trans isomerase family protein n=1 Tax=Salinarchaeum sp. IM2453 TaxID=2862870 RepID=UPI001C833303|nr:aspartate/glutamate racemase family protein [Salinarchaeum sp. IM2453]QZA88384.1 aspartate/glutamate racemase family protein [Salinarchaeum sp. IM2453]
MSKLTRIGVVVPSTNTTTETEFGRTIDDSLSVHVARMPLSSVTAADLKSMRNRATGAVERVSDASVDAIAYACTTGSLLEGPEYARRLESELEQTAGVPTVVTARSVDRALSTLNKTQILVVTPYNQELVERERSYLNALGYNVVHISGRRLENNAAIGALSPEAAADQVLSEIEGVSDIDAVFISCTNYPTFSRVESLESELNVPVVTSNSATLWDVLQTAGIDPNIVPGQLSATTT